MSDTPIPPGGSILDRVLQSQQTVALEHFDPVEIINDLLKQISAKEADVLRRRYGLGHEQGETLENIGRYYKVTRERVRQIERWAIQHLAKSSTTKHSLRTLETLLQQLLQEHGGLLLEEDLYAQLLSHSGSASNAQAAIRFLLEELMIDKLERIKEPDYKPYWRMKRRPAANLQPVIAAATRVIERAGRPMAKDALLTELRQDASLQQSPELTDTVIFSYLSVSANVERNPFGEWGLRQWGSIVPKRMNDKIMLVMRKVGKPMHYQDIAKKINEIGFDDRQAYPPTVHNELILSQDYVLIGRGIYALREWGYKPGVVADVIQAILAESPEPLSREDLVKKVMEQRMVKRNTIHLALTNKKLFARLPDGRYSLADGVKTNTDHEHHLHAS